MHDIIGPVRISVVTTTPDNFLPCYAIFSRGCLKFDRNLTAGMSNAEDRSHLSASNGSSTLKQCYRVWDPGSNPPPARLLTQV